MCGGAIFVDFHSEKGGHVPFLPREVLRQVDFVPQPGTVFVHG
jgi:hypothetical protein